MNFVKRIFARETPFFLVCPALIWQFLFLYIPLLVLFVDSFFRYSNKIKSFYFTFLNYQKILQPSSLKIFLNSFFLAFETTVICLLVAYPLAYFLVFKSKKFRMFLLLLLILPSWTSIIIQIYAWFFLLKKGSILSQSLYNMGFISEPFHMLNNHFAMIVGMVYCYLPFMALPIYASLENIDRKLIEASADLGASRFITLSKIILPLSAYGILAGISLVFIPAFGEFAIPELLGGSKKLFWGNVIVGKFLDYRDWNSGSAFVYSGVLLPVIFLFLIYYVIKSINKFRFKC